MALKVHKRIGGTNILCTGKYQSTLAYAGPGHSSTSKAGSRSASEVFLLLFCRDNVSDFDG